MCKLNLNKDTHVYCTRCIHFPAENVAKPFQTPRDENFKVHCIHEEECWFWDWEDSRSYEMRKCYEPMYEELGWLSVNSPLTFTDETWDNITL